MEKHITVIPPKAVCPAEAAAKRKIRTAAYCRVSTLHEEQQSSYENQVRYYMEYISQHPDYVFSGIYADEGLSGTHTRRQQFQCMLEDCRQGKLDLILTKSISRFSRNTLDCLRSVRELKQLGVDVYFEKENIHTLDAKGEVLLTILSSLAQDESRSISENCTWGIRRQFEQGEYRLATTRFLGYDQDEQGRLVPNPAQAKIVQRIFQDFLNGLTPGFICHLLEKEKIANWDGSIRWHPGTIQSILQNEKYKGDVLLQKTYCKDFLNKKRQKNKGEIPSYYLKKDHEAIIPDDVWELAQLELERRTVFQKQHHLSCYSRSTASNPFSCKVICGICGHPYVRKIWRRGAPAGKLPAITLSGQDTQAVSPEPLADKNLCANSMKHDLSSREERMTSGEQAAITQSGYNDPYDASDPHIQKRASTTALPRKAGRKIWQCGEKYRPGQPCDCGNRHLEENTLWKAYFLCLEQIQRELPAYHQKWRSLSCGEDLLLQFRGKTFLSLFPETMRVLWTPDIFLMLRTLSHITIHPSGLLLIEFLDGSCFSLQGR